MQTNPPPITHRPLQNPGQILDALLKRPAFLLAQLQHGGQGWIAPALAGIALAALALYGLVVGSQSGGEQLWAAPLKIALGTLSSVLICLPSLYIFASLSGADTSLRQITGTLSAVVALSAVLLVGFAPVAWIFSQSTDSLVLMGTMHLLFWFIGTVFGLRLLRLLAPPETRSPHLRVWSFIFILVCLQMTTALRPIVGTADILLPREKRFFLVHWLDVLHNRPASPSGPSTGTLAPANSRRKAGETPSPATNPFLEPSERN